MDTETARKTYLTWVLYVVFSAFAIFAVVSVIPDVWRQWAIPVSYVIIVSTALAAAVMLYRSAWRMLRGGTVQSAKFAFAVATVLVCEALEQGWWVGVRVSRHLNDGKPILWLYDHPLIALWITGLAVAITYLLKILEPRT